MDFPLCQDLTKQPIVLQSKSNLLFEYSILVFLSVSHPLQYHLGYDDNKFLILSLNDIFGLIQKFVVCC